MNSDALWLAAAELLWLLDNQENRESEYQALFERHPIIFDVLGFDACASFEKKSVHKLPRCKELGFSPEPDFIAADTSKSAITIIDLKTPFVPSSSTDRDTSRQKFRATVESYLAQLADYLQCVRGSEGARSVVCDALHLKTISSYSSMLIYGMSNEEDASKRERLKDQRKDYIEMLAFDEVLRKIISRYSVGRYDVESRDGISIAMSFRLHHAKAAGRGYVFDIGRKSHDRISLFVEHDVLVCQCLDSHGVSHVVRAPANFGALQFIRLAVAVDQKTMLLSCRLNDQEVGLQTGAIPFPLDLDVSSFCMGSDIAGASHGHFDIFEYKLISKTISLFDQIRLRNYMYDKTAESSPCMEFAGQHRMLWKANKSEAPSEQEGPLYKNPGPAD